jgi:Type IV secretion system pilin
MRIIKLFLLTFSSLGILLMASPVYAVDTFDEVCKQPRAQDSTVCKGKELGGKNPLFGPDGVITAVIEIVSIIVGIAAVIVIILGGLKFITSGSNPQEVTKARETILYAIVGLAIAALAQII